MKSSPSRREFLALTGSGLYVFFEVEPLSAQEPARIPGGRPQGYPTDFNA